MTTPGLALALRQVGRHARRVVVVTDRYPPHSVGGAEVSLHIVLRALSMGTEVLVVTFGDKNLTARVYCHEGVDVLELPRQARWPRHQIPHGLEARLGNNPFAKRVLGRVVETFATRPGAIGESAVVAQAVRSNASPRGGVPLDAVEWEDGLMARDLRKVLQSLRPQVVHADNYRSIVVTAHASRGLGVHTVGVVRDNRFHCARYDQSVRTVRGFCAGCDFACASEDDPESPERQRRLLQVTTRVRQDAIRSLDKTVVTSAYLEEQLSRIVPGDRVVRIPNTPDDAGSADEWMMGVPELPGMNLLVVGMINENKGQLGLVRGLTDLVGMVPDVHLHLAGRGPRLESKLRELLERQGLSHRVTFHGHVDRPTLYALYRRCQIVVLPTLWPEPFGRVPLEAGMARRPVVSFSVGGLRESILDGATGLLVPPDDYESLFVAIRKLAVSPETCRAMGERAREHVLRTYMLDQVTNKLRELWASFGDGSHER